MEISPELIKGQVMNCYNSLILDVRLADNSLVPVFCGSSEAAKLCYTGVDAIIKRHRDSLRKIRYELEFISRSEGLILVNPTYNGFLFQEAFDNGVLSADFDAYNVCRRIEPDEHLPHIDFELSSPSGNKCYVFIENVFNKQNGCSVFPAGINFFEMAMFEELAKLRRQGHKTVIFMLVPRQDCVEAKFSWNLDPVAAARIYDEAKNGLEFVCYGCNIDKKSVTLANKMKILY
ncbi:MAG: DNA/RNA nuclease SfsA [Proteobacteria bacterium]|nr:DNA/RNA nuclease SfsA [Pseudomonadota bacterium]